MSQPEKSDRWNYGWFFAIAYLALTLTEPSGATLNVLAEGVMLLSSIYFAIAFAVYANSDRAAAQVEASKARSRRKALAPSRPEPLQLEATAAVPMDLPTAKLTDTLPRLERDVAQREFDSPTQARSAAPLPDSSPPPVKDDQDAAAIAAPRWVGDAEPEVALEDESWPEVAEVAAPTEAESLAAIDPTAPEPPEAELAPESAEAESSGLESTAAASTTAGPTEGEPAPVAAFEAPSNPELMEPETAESTPAVMGGSAPEGVASEAVEPQLTEPEAFESHPATVDTVAAPVEPERAEMEAIAASATVERTEPVAVDEPEPEIVELEASEPDLTEAELTTPASTEAEPTEAEPTATEALEELSEPEAAETALAETALAEVDAIATTGSDPSETVTAPIAAPPIEMATRDAPEDENLGNEEPQIEEPQPTNMLPDSTSPAPNESPATQTQTRESPANPTPPNPNLSLESQISELLVVRSQVNDAPFDELPVNAPTDAPPKEPQVLQLDVTPRDLTPTDPQGETEPPEPPGAESIGVPESTPESSELDPLATDTSTPVSWLWGEAADTDAHDHPSKQED